MTATEKQPTMGLMIVQIRLNEAQIDRLSEISGNLSLVFFAAMVLPILTTKTYSLFDATVGISLALICVFISMVLLKGRKS